MKVMSSSGCASFASRRYGSAIISVWLKHGMSPADRQRLKEYAAGRSAMSGFIGSLPPNSAVVSFTICDIAKALPETLWKPRSARAAA